MVETFAATIAKLEDLSAHYYRCLLSGDPGHTENALEFAAAIERVAGGVRTFGDLADLKDWIANRDRAKNLAFLNELRRRAKGNQTPTWEARARTARILRYAGLFRRAYKRFGKAIKKIEVGGVPPNPMPEAKAQVYYDFAEYLAYMGYTRKATTLIDGITPDADLAWFHWVRAFIAHQSGFTTDHQPSSITTDDDPGADDHYLASNDHLDTALGITGSWALPPAEVPDTFLLRAANWGAIWRGRLLRGDSPGNAPTEAASALDEFMHGANADPINACWSIRKEKRGRFPARYFLAIDGDIDSTLDPSKVARWREFLGRHYYKNLRQAGLQEEAADVAPSQCRDGDIDTIDDHGADDDEP